MHDGKYRLFPHSNTTLFSALSLSHTLEIGYRQSGPVDECSKEKKGKVWVGKKQTQDESWRLAKERTPRQEIL